MKYDHNHIEAITNLENCIWHDKPSVRKTERVTAMIDAYFLFRGCRPSCLKAMRNLIQRIDWSKLQNAYDHTFRAYDIQYALFHGIIHYTAVPHQCYARLHRTLKSYNVLMENCDD